MSSTISTDKTTKPIWLSLLSSSASCVLLSMLLCSCASRIQTPNGLATVNVMDKSGDAASMIASAGPGEKVDLASDEIICKRTMEAWNLALSHDKHQKMSDDEWKAARKTDEAESMKLLNTLADNYPRVSYIKLMMGQVQQHFGHKEEAAKYYEESTLLNRPDPIIVFKAAEMRRQSGDTTRALKYYRRVQELSKDFPGARLGEALCLSKDKATAEEGKKILQDLVAAYPKDKDAQAALDELNSK